MASTTASGRNHRFGLAVALLLVSTLTGCPAQPSHLTFNGEATVRTSSGIKHIVVQVPEIANYGRGGSKAIRLSLRDRSRRSDATDDGEEIGYVELSQGVRAGQSLASRAHTFRVESLPSAREPALRLVLEEWTEFGTIVARDFRDVRGSHSFVARWYERFTAWHLAAIAAVILLSRCTLLLPESRGTASVGALRSMPEEIR